MTPCFNILSTLINFYNFVWFCLFNSRQSNLAHGPHHQAWVRCLNISSHHRDRPHFVVLIILHCNCLFIYLSSLNWSCMKAETVACFPWSYQSSSKPTNKKTVAENSLSFQFKKYKVLMLSKCLNVYREIPICLLRRTFPAMIKTETDRRRLSRKNHWAFVSLLKEGMVQHC